MPKKHRVDYLKQSSATSRSPSAASASDKPKRSVNELLANLRNGAAASSSSTTNQQLSSTTPSVPPVIREILQIPETPAPQPRRAIRRRFDNSERRLPAGPPPPQSWTTSNAASTSASRRHGGVSLNASLLRDVTLPGDYLPENGSFISILLKAITRNWDAHKIYDQYYLYDIPSHLKPALIRYICTTRQAGLTLPDLKALFTPPPDEDGNMYEEAENSGVSHLDIAGSAESTVHLKQLADLLFPQQPDSDDEPSESWDDEANSLTSKIRPSLVPSLTHLSLALNPQEASKASWKQLLAMAPKLSGITHLCLAYWPTPCLTRHAQSTTIASPQGKSIPYGGTNMYSHSLDQDWSEALLLLKILSKNLYALEYLDLTGCSTWFKALMLQDDQDYVDWTSNWGKISVLRLKNGWTPDHDPMPSKQMEYIEACNTATAVEKHIISMRAGRGRFLTVDKDRLDV